MERPPLLRSRDDAMLAGVCSGLARHLGATPQQVRIGLGLLALLGGAGVLLYLWLWATVPREGESEGVAPLRSALTRAAELPPRARRWPIAELLLGVCLLLAGVGLVLDRFGVHLNLEVLLPGIAVLAGVGLTWWQVADRNRPERNQVPRVLGALVLVAVGVLMFFVTAREPSAWTVVAAALAVLAGVGLAVAPWLLRMNRELIAERAAREREAERASIAAHLHDSVLQTLALIQQRAEPGTEVARLARGQERELRDWLFRSGDGAGADTSVAVDTDLRAHAAGLEAAHAVQFEIVTVGAAADAVAPEAIVAAAREAMLNAARHAGGEVTVYIEVGSERVAVDITDRGPGFSDLGAQTDGGGLDLDSLPEGRMGVRESIVGRMQRAGGTARIVPGPGGNGVSVRLSLPLASDAGQRTTLPGDADQGSTVQASPAPGAAEYVDSKEEHHR